jgi:hypothetical protein
MPNYHINKHRQYCTFQPKTLNIYNSTNYHVHIIIFLISAKQKWKNRFKTVKFEDTISCTFRHNFLIIRFYQFCCLNKSYSINKTNMNDLSCWRHNMPNYHINKHWQYYIFQPKTLNIFNSTNYHVQCTCNYIFYFSSLVIKLEAQMSLYRSPDINKSSWECLHAEYI